MMTPSARIDRRTALVRGVQAAAALCTLPTGLLAGRQPPPGAAPQDPASRFIRVGGLRLHYLEWSRGADDRRPSLVLLHAGMLNARVWERVGRTLAPFFRVVAPDARGHGESEWKRPYETAVLLDDLHGVVTGLGLRDLTLCGNSMGGTLAIGYAATHPDAVRRLISVDTGAAPPPAPGSTGGTPRPALPPPLPDGPFASRDDAASRIDPIMGRGFIEAMATTNLTRGDDGRWRWKHDSAGLAEGLPQAMADPGRWTRWQRVTCPTLLLRGERSPALSDAMAQRMIEARTNVTLRVVTDAGHFVTLDQPDAFEAIVKAWLAV